MDIKRILIVEDEPFILDMYKEVLQTQNVEVVTAKNGKEAEDLVKGGSQYDVILLDIMMPKLSGLDFLEDTRRKKIALSSVIILTNLPDQGVIDRCFALGAVGSIMKSDITPNQLLPRIRRILETKTVNP